MAVYITYQTPPAVISAARTNIVIAIGTDLDTPLFPLDMSSLSVSFSSVSEGGGVCGIGPGISTGPTRAFLDGILVANGFDEGIGEAVPAGLVVEETDGDDTLGFFDEPEDIDGFVDELDVEPDGFVAEPDEPDVEPDEPEDEPEF